MARASIRQVAEHAGVSPMTVSRVLRGSPGLVAAKNRERVLASVRELDYVPVRSALQNRHVETRVIGVGMDDILSHRSRLVGDNTLHGLREAAFASGYDLLLLRSHSESSLEQQKGQFLDRRSDGFILVSILVSSRQRQEVLENLVRHRLPAVSCYYRNVPPGVAWIVPDDASAMHQAAGALVQAGHYKIGHMVGPQSYSASGYRHEAFVSVMTKMGLKPYCHQLKTRDDQEVRKATADLVRQGATAIIGFNDSVALQVWNAAREQGLHIPRDLSVIGVDDMPEAAERGLTTFATPFQEIGRTAVESLVALLQGGDVEEYCRALPMKMVARNSVAPPHSHRRA